MRIDVAQSQHHESPGARNEFSKSELKHARVLLRRLRFLEMQIRENGGLENGGGSGGAAFTEWEHDSLEWVLGPDGINFLDDKALPTAAHG